MKYFREVVEICGFKHPSVLLTRNSGILKKYSSEYVFRNNDEATPELWCIERTFPRICRGTSFE